MLAQLRLGGARAGAQGYEGDRSFAPLLARRCDDRGLEHGRMADQRRLDLDGGDVLTAGDDDILAAIADLDVAVRMHHADIAGSEPAVRDRTCGRVRVPVCGVYAYYLTYIH